MLFQPFLRGQVAQALPIPVDFRERAALELDGFPEYAAEVTPQQRAAIEELAKQIVRSNDTRDPIFEFRVEGHADIARRISDPRERKAQEEVISTERALVGRELLVAALKKHGGDDLANKINRGSRTFGLGTRQLKLPNARTEEEFRRNRRVVFIVRQVTFLPPAPRPPDAPQSVVEDRFEARLMSALVTTLGLIPGAPVNVDGVVVKAKIAVTDKIDRKRAEFDVSALGAGVSASPFPVGGSLSFTAGPNVPFRIFRLLGRNRVPIGVDNFVGAVTVMIDPSGGVGPPATSKGGTMNFSFDALETSGCNTQPGVIPLPGGSGSLSTPGFSSPIVLPVGSMTMIGKPTSF